MYNNNIEKRIKFHLICFFKMGKEEWDLRVSLENDFSEGREVRS